MKFVAVASLTVTVLLAAIPSLHAQQHPASAGPSERPLPRQDWLVPSTVPGVPMRTAILLPQGSGPFPLVVINHGSTADEEERKGEPLPTFEPIASWFASHGYLVALPQRPGHGETGGPYLEDIGSCEYPDYEDARPRSSREYRSGGPISDRPADRSENRRSACRSFGRRVGSARGSKPRVAAALRAVINFAGGLGGHSYERAEQQLRAGAAGAGRRSFRGNQLTFRHCGSMPPMTPILTQHCQNRWRMHIAAAAAWPSTIYCRPLARMVIS